MKAFAISTKFAALAMALLAASVLSVEAQQAVTAKVRAVRGSAKYSDNGAWHPLRVNAVLPVGTVIETGPESTVDLFINNSVIRITPETTFGVTKATATDTGAEQVTDTELYLKSGRILGNVKKLSAASKYQVKTPNGVTGIRGTEFDISFINGLLKVRCVNGTLISSAANRNGNIKTAVINQGETWSPDDEFDTQPEPDLPGPDFQGDEDGAQLPVPKPEPTIIHEEPGLGDGTSPI